MSQPKLSPAVFLDRDDTLMPNVPYCGDPKKVEAYPKAPEALRRLREAGFQLIMVSNQSGVGRGYITEEQVAAVNAELYRQLGLELDSIYLCYEDPNNPATIPASGISERKPSPVLVHRAAAERNLDLARSFFVGDRMADVRCGRNAGIPSVMLTTNPEDQHFEAAKAEAEVVVPGIAEAAEWILRQVSGPVAEGAKLSHE